MRIVNRGYLSVLPSGKFWEWANANCQEDNLLFQNDEPSIYLIEEDFWEEDSVVTAYQLKKFGRLFQVSKNSKPTFLFHQEIWSLIY